MDAVCTRCLMALCSPSSQLYIMPRGEYGDTEAQWWNSALQDASSGTLARKAEIIGQGVGMGWDVEINGQRVTAPLTTWHGDPICEAHLYYVAEQERQPRTVRMAQWAPGRASGR
jgi:hypothetical protein